MVDCVFYPVPGRVFVIQSARRSRADGGSMSEMDEAAPLSGEEEEAAEETREAEPADTPTPDPSSEVTGKRTKKTVARLEIQMAKPKEKLKVEDGGGDRLGDIPRTNHMIGKLKPGDLKPLHSIMFDRPGKTASMRKNMRQFNGFPFDVDSKQFTKKRDKLLRWSSLTNLKLRAICKVLDLEKKGSQVDLVNRILVFLSEPKNSGKPLLAKKKKKSKKRLSGADPKPRPRSTSSSPKKTKTTSKSKAIVMETSSDEDQEEEEEEDDKTGRAGGEEEEEEEETKESGTEKSDESEDDEEEEEEEEEKEAPRARPPARKPASKRPRAPTKKSPAPRKRSKKVLSESESQEESEVEEKPQKARRAAPPRPAAKTKKADSSSNSKKTNSTVSEESSEDDRPLIKMVRVSPSDQQLKETVQGLLKDCDLEEITMKQICQRVYDTYPDHDLASRKDYIKQTVKSLIT